MRTLCSVLLCGFAAVAQALTFLASGRDSIPDPNALVAPLFGGRTIFENPPAQLPEGLNQP